MPQKHTRKATADGSPLAQFQSRPTWSLGAWPRPAHAVLSLAGAIDAPSAGATPADAPSTDTPATNAPPSASAWVASPGAWLATAASAVTVSAWLASPDGVAGPSSPPAGCPTAREPRGDVIYVPSSGRLNQANAGPFTIPDSRRSRN